MSLVPLSLTSGPRNLRRSETRALEGRRAQGNARGGGVILYRDAAGNYSRAEILDQPWSDASEADEFLAADALALYAAVTHLRAGGERSRLNTWI